MSPKRGLFVLLMLAGVSGFQAMPGFQDLHRLQTVNPATERRGEPARTEESGAMLLRSPASMALLDSARQALYVYGMEEAERWLEQLGRQADGEAAARYHEALVELHRAMVSGREEAFDEFQARSDALADVLSGHQPAPWRDYMDADRRLWESLAHFQRGRYVRGAWAARGAYRSYSRVVQADSTLYDAYVGLGLLHLAIGSMPRSLRFVLDVLGFSGGIARGLAELETAYLNARYADVPAGLCLALTQAMLYLDEEKGLRITGALHRRHPASPLVAHAHGFMLISSRRPLEAVATLRAAVRRSEEDGYLYNTYLDYYLADALFKLDDFAGAERQYRRYIDRQEGPALKAVAYLGLGLSLEMQGRRDEAKSAYAEVRASRTFDTDEMARRRADHLLSGPLSAIDRSLLLAANALDSGRLDVGVAMLTALREDAELSDNQAAETAYRLGRLHHVGGRFDRALDEYALAERMRGDPRSRWAPWSAFFAGKIHLAEGRAQAARAAFDRALSYPRPYDFYQALEQSVRAALDVGNP